MPEINALVPMRHHSQRVPGKNYRELAGLPLYHHILKTLLSVPELTGIYVDTDSPLIAEGIGNDFPSINVIDRPQHLRADDIPMNDVLAHDLSVIGGTYYLQTHSTNPLLKTETISAAIQAFFSELDRFDSLFTVTRLQTRLYDMDGRAVNHNPQELLQTQDLPPLYEENSCIYLFSKDSLEEHGHRIGSNPQLFEINADEAWDIDNELDFSIVDFLMRSKNE